MATPALPERRLCGLDGYASHRDLISGGRLTGVAGGPTRSELWMQIHADVSNLPISLTRVGESAVLGSAMLAAVGAGVYPDIQTAARYMVHTERTIEPDPERHEEYAFYVDRYVETYPRMRELMHETVSHVAGAATAAGTLREGE